MSFDQPVFLRIDTENGSPCLADSSCESVITSLLSVSDKGWFDLLGFVVLPSELQLMVVPHGKTINDLLSLLESTVAATIGNSELVFDKDFYREKVDSEEEVRMRLRWMLQAPVRSRLANMSEAYPYSSANERFRDVVKASQRVM